MIVAVIVQGKELLQSVIASVVAGVGVTFAFSMAIWGAVRFVDLSRGERPLAAAGAVLVAVVALAVTVGAIVVGIVVMTSK
ncbi:MAG TPA: hypothetical protein VFP23_03715 [Solirubrobacterales bacterium]|nr:hypothetical protein [Solirubrobacterales bacterium]